MIRRLHSTAYVVALGLTFSLLSPMPAWADRAEDLLGVHQLRPVVREVLDESFGQTGVLQLKAAVQSGQMSAGDAAAQLLADQHHSIE